MHNEDIPNRFESFKVNRQLLITLSSLTVCQTEALIIYGSHLFSRPLSLTSLICRKTVGFLF